MAVENVDVEMNDDEYDEEADSDFDEAASQAESESSEDGIDEIKISSASKGKATSKPHIEEFDSGDEATIKERKKSKKKQKKKKDGNVSSDDDNQGDGWRAKTRSMRAQDQVEKQQKRIADIKTSTIDVNQIWEEMNRPGPLPPLRMEGEEMPQASEKPSSQNAEEVVQAQEKMITIKRQFKFAGEVHFEEKMVPESSAEAQLWLLQKQNDKPAAEEIPGGRQRPLRKISRFDPNYSNLDAFRNDAIRAQAAAFKGPKLNVVEKSKMDWATHVDAEGLQDELAEHSKAKGAYLNRMDFLSEVEKRKEEEARVARQKG